MALLTAGTTTTTILKALKWLPSGMNQSDLAALQQLMKNPNANVTYGGVGRIENGLLFLPGDYSKQGIIIRPGDYICVDANGWPIIVNGTVANQAGTSWNGL